LSIQYSYIFDHLWQIHCQGKPEPNHIEETVKEIGLPKRRRKNKSSVSPLFGNVNIKNVIVSLIWVFSLLIGS
jgi:hypothetical protein